MSRPLEASLGMLHIFAAHAAIDKADDIRAQRWLAEKLPAEYVQSERVMHFPSPIVSLHPEMLFHPAWKPGGEFSGHPVLVAAQARREVYDRTAMTGYLRGETVVTYGAAEAPPYSQVIVDWLNALPDFDQRMLDKLGRVTWQQAIDHAVRWHDRIAAKRADGVASEGGTADRLDVQVMPGWYWVHLVTERALDNEGAVMGHCVGSGYDHTTWVGGVRPDDWRADAGIWSLRDPTGRSRVTVEIAYDGIVQAQGPGNARPVAETVPAFAVLLDRFEQPGVEFDVPYWLFREESGATRLRTDGEARTDFLRDAQRYAIAPGQVMFRLPGSDSWANLGDVDEVRLDMQPTRRARYVQRGTTQLVEAIMTALESEIKFTATQFSGFTEALRLMTEKAFDDAALGVVSVPEQAEEIRYTAPAIARAPSRRARHEAGQPWYRQHERQRIGRAAR